MRETSCRLEPVTTRYSVLRRRVGPIAAGLPNEWIDLGEAAELGGRKYDVVEPKGPDA
jgi:hypothetical protein